MAGVLDASWGGYPLSERDRRWSSVRENAARAGFDCIFVPPGNRFDLRYLTLMPPGSAVILPTQGGDPIVVNDRGQKNEWITEARSAGRGGGRSWAELLAQVLVGAGAERGRVGVVGLEGGRVTYARSPDGVVIHGAYAGVTSRLPHATFADATDVVGFARYTKSDWEIECLRHAAAIAEAGIEEMVAVARPGVAATVLYAEVTRRMMSLGGEHYPQGWAITLEDPGEHGGIRYTQPPLGRVLQAGTLIENEVSGVWGGFQAQEDQPILLAPTPETWSSVIDLQGEAFDAGLGAMVPGTEFADLSRVIRAVGERKGMKTSLTMSCRGLGDDAPLVTPPTADDPRDYRIDDRTVWLYKPTATSEDGKLSFQWGGTVLVTPSGGQKLFQRPHGLVSI